ncbi:ComEC/Rec2 family competence protein [Croceivirga thetidis]|uniref:ComEC family competence protein n=1 Tax=Croceivirga thetidis TaxID=2721623 RepID=A0ABX1GRL6_9FLAO|nr:ComEC/Rec2 family competence protein [Croceivirga thetidis]NKI31690.1 ComEC family competence protein [Croceivirga thetidis]
MRNFQFISIKLTLGLITGILLGYYFSINPIYPGISIPFLLIALGYYKKKEKRDAFPIFGLLAALLLICLGILVVTLSNLLSNRNHYAKQLSGQEQLFEIKVKSVLKPTSFSERYVVAVKYCDSSKVSGKLLLNLPLDSITNEFKIDDEFVFIGAPELVKKPLNPHQFDYKDYLKKQGISHQIRLEKAPLVKIPKPSKTLVGIASNFRDDLIKNLKTYNFGEAELSVIQALILGKRDDISNETYNDYKNAGAVHILAVSGLHIGILLIILQFLFKPLEVLRKGKQLKTVLVITALWVFAVIAGLSPSVVRAVTMFSFLAYAMNLNRPTNTFNIIALSIFFILLFKPLFLFQVGFQMSYLAVLAIVWIYPKLQRFWYPDNWLIRKLWQLLSVSLSAQLGVLPLSLFYFHQFPSLFFITNLIVVPFLGLILGIGVLVVVLAAMKALPEFLVEAYNYLITQMNAIISWVGNQEGFVFRDIPYDQVQLILGYAFIIGMVLYLTKPKFKNIVMFLGSLSGLLIWGIFNQYSLKTEERLILLHQTRNSVIIHQTAENLTVLHRNENLNQKIVNDFRVAERITEVKSSDLRNSYSIDGKSLVILDSTGVYPNQLHLDYVLLTESPKINLERLLDSIKPKVVLADGSNYKSYVHRWEATCLKRKVPFHHTGEKGAYYFKLNK